jgi:hypothetical protein
MVSKEYGIRGLELVEKVKYPVSFKLAPTVNVEKRKAEFVWLFHQAC